MKYTIQDFTRILKSRKNNDLPKDISKLILSLVNKVGSPEYIKTPQFKTKKKYNNNNNNNNNNNKSIIVVNNINDQRSFTKTIFEKKEGVDLNLHKIRIYLNKIADDTYDIISKNIIDEINLVLSEKTINDYNYICKEVYNMLTTSTLYSKIYTNLYLLLINEFQVFNELLNNNFDNYKLLIDNIEYSKPEEDYDKFCENNKKNKELIGIITFYVNLFKSKNISKEIFYNIITNMFDILDNMIISNNKQNEMDIISELIYILITSSYNEINENNKIFAKSIYDNIKRIATLKKKDSPGITNKCIFKHMDIFEMINK